MILEREALSFDDVLLIPQEGVLDKRADADISSSVVSGIKVDIPIISSPMASVTEGEMAKAMRLYGGYGIIHRFLTIDEQIDQFKMSPLDTAVAIGINEGYERWEKLFVAGCHIFCLDVAHAHHTAIRDFISKAPDELLIASDLIVGNVATYYGAHFLAELGVAAIKVGIGPGAACTTREVTGFGYPQLSAIMNVAKVIDKFPDVRIIADGGIRNSGDIVKALAAGADTVMLGRLFAGADESPHPGLYWGMASKRVNGHHAPEGVEGVVPRTGSVGETMKNLAWGIRSGISYGGATNLEELRRYSQFVRVTPMSMQESGIRI